MTGFVVVRADDGRFMDSTGCWRREFPDANVFPEMKYATQSVRKCFRGRAYVYTVDGYTSGEQPRCTLDNGRVSM